MTPVPATPPAPAAAGGRGPVPWPRSLLVLLVLLTWAGSLRGSWQFDDFFVIVQEPRVHSLAAWALDLARGIRPLLKLTYTLGWISGAGLPGFHLVNLGIHLANVLLVRALALRVVPGRRAPEAAFLAAALFAVHPILTEGVTYVCGRSDSLTACFILLGVLAYARARTEGRAARARLLPLPWFLAAILVKETALVFPFLLLVWEWARHGLRRGSGHALRYQWPAWGLVPLLGLLLLLHPRYAALLGTSLAVRHGLANLTPQVDAFCYLGRRMLLPTGLNFDPDLAVHTGLDALHGFRLLALAALGASAILGLRRFPAASFGVLWAFLALLPTHSLIARFDLVNERQAYLPMAGLAVAAGWGGSLLLARLGRRGWIPVSALLLALAAGTWARNRVYRTEVSMWQDVTRKSPFKARGFNNLGYALALEDRKAEAEAAYLRALALDPGYALAKGNLDELRNPSPGQGAGD